MNPEIFHIGNFSIRWYSVLILCGVMIGYFLAVKEGKKHGISKDTIFDLAFWLVIIGILGARIYYVVFNFSYYKNNFWQIFAVWNGGLAIHGGIIAGFITLVIYCKKYGLKIWKMTDIAAPSLILAQAIGRWGNFFNSEAHGPVTTLENLERLHIPEFIIKGMNIGGVYYHPTFLYESIWCVVGFCLMLLIRKFYKYLKNGQLTCFYFMWYGIGRFFIESLRTDSLMLGKFKVAQLVSICLVICGLVGFIYLCFNRLKKGLYYDNKGTKKNEI